MKNLNYVWKSAVGAFVVTIASALIPSTPGQLVGASWYGWPVTWLRKLVIAPQYNPWVVDWYGLVLDIIFWFVVILAVGYVMSLLMGKNSSTSAASKSKMKK